MNPLNFLKKYYMPASMTWWVGMAMILSGVIMNLSALFGFQETMLLTAIHFIWQSIPPEFTGLPDGNTAVPPNVLVAAGMALIGLRRATGDKSS